jgi:hypothetical protein
MFDYGLEHLFSCTVNLNPPEVMGPPLRRSYPVNFREGVF